MEVIPVIDLMGGCVVRARAGERASYRAIETPLAAGAAPRDIVKGLLTLHDFRTLYVADLDAIERRGDHRRVICGLRDAFSSLTIWVDDGAGDAAAIARWRGQARIVPVLGSESLPAPDVVRTAGETAILSLDFRGDDFLGAPALLDAAFWPQRVIVMTLARVGSHAGPDLARLTAIRAQARGRSVYAAGGVRDARDLETLKQAGVAGALVSSALHSGSLDAAALARLS
ncbi:MAG: histidine biosynthesis protein [Hyphomicrobiales bacterium]|nr:histidine biosynthesis protein [Hyphomicrobiales bacterium]